MFSHLTIYDSQMEAGKIGKVSAIRYAWWHRALDSNTKLPLSPSRDVYVITHLRINLQRNPQRVLKTDCYSVVLSWCEKKILPSLILSQAATDSTGLLLPRIWMNTEDFLPCSAAAPSVQSAHMAPADWGQTPPCSPVPVLAPWSGHSPGPCAGDERLLA